MTTRSLLLPLLLGISWTASWAAPQGSDQREAWGGAVDGVQLGLTIASSSSASGTSPPLQVQIRNQGKQPIAYAEAALLHPEMEIDGVWYAQTLADDCCASPKAVAGGARSEPVSLRLPRALTITSDMAATRYIGLPPGRHAIRVRIPARDLASVRAASSHPLALTSNLIRVEVPPTTGTGAFSSYPNPVALSCKAGPGRRSEEFHGNLQRGEKFSQTAGGWIFRLAPQMGAGPGAGWLVEVSATGREGEEFSRITPPWHFVPNSREINGWHFRNADNTGPNDGSVNAPGELREFIFSPRVGRDIWGTASSSEPTAEQMAAVRAFGRGWLFIDSYQLTPPKKGEQAAFESLAFRACLTWPADQSAR